MVGATPDDPAGPGRCVVVRSGWVSGRDRPSHRAEQVTQWVCGEVLRVAERREAWWSVTDRDGYAAWVVAGSVLAVSAEAAEAWRERASARSLGCDLAEARPGSGEPIAPPPRLPWGARVGLRPDGRVELPGGARARPADPDRVVSAVDRPGRFPPRGGAVVRSARRWLGVPYAWGGRTEAGVDCSGLVQAVFALHGASLPRDSGAQREAGPDVPGGPGETWAETRPGDLLFFAPEGKGVTHVAISTGGSSILHAASTRGCVASDDLAGASDFLRRLAEAVVGHTRPLASRPGEVLSPR